MHFCGNPLHDAPLILLGILPFLTRVKPFLSHVLSKLKELL